MKNILDDKTIVIANSLGFKVCTVEEQMKFGGVKTIERFERLDPQYHPILIRKNKNSGDDHLFTSNISYLFDWSSLMKIAIKLNLENLPTNKEKAIDLLYNKLK